VKRAPRARPDKMDTSDICGAKPQSKIRPLGRPPVHSNASHHRPIEQQPRKAMQEAGFNIISHQPKSSSSQSRAAHEDQMSQQYSQAAPSRHSDAKENQGRYNRSMDVRDITGPKKNLYGNRHPQPDINMNDYAGARKAADVLSQNGNNFVKPQKNKSNVFSHLDMSEENYHALLNAKRGA